MSHAPAMAARPSVALLSPVLLYARLLGGLAVPYALFLTAETVRRADEVMRLSTARGWLTTLAWAELTTVPLFAGLGALSALLMIGMAAVSPRRAGFVAASIVQGGLLTVILTWAYVNQAVDYYTGEALTLGTLHFIWENPTEVFQTTWKLARWRLGGIGIGAVLGLVGLPIVVHRLNRAWYAQCIVRPDGDPSVPVVSRRRRREGRVYVGVVLLLFVALAWQLAGTPSVALIELARTSPPLRFFALAGRLVDTDLRMPLPPIDGPPILSDAAYAETMVREPRPARNVVLVLLESVPARALGCYGYPRDVSPHIDAIAAEGVVFENAIATASFSAYGEVSIFTSLYMLRGEANDHFARIDYPFKTLHTVLKLRGYELATFSSANESFENVIRFLTPDAFDVWFSHETAAVEKFDANRLDDKYAVAAFTEWLAARDSSRPFFCYLNLQSTHFDYQVPPPWDAHFEPTMPYLSSGNGIIRIPPDQLPKLRNQYDNALRYLDHFVGRIHEALIASGEMDETIVVLVGDHGEAFMEHGLARHGLNLFQEVIHVPLIVSAPGLLDAGRRSVPASQIDINPTVAGLLGLRPHPSWQGVDLFGTAARHDRPLFSVLQLSRRQEAVIQGGWKYIFDLTDGREWLFDLTEDPGETTNRIRLRTDQRRRLKDLLGRFHTHQLAYYGDRGRYTQRYIGRKFLMTND